MQISTYSVTPSRNRFDRRRPCRRISGRLIIIVDAGGVQSQSTEPMSAVTAAGKRDGKRQKKRLTGTETEEHFAFGNQDYLWQWLVTK